MLFPVPLDVYTGPSQVMGSEHGEDFLIYPEQSSVPNGTFLAEPACTLPPTLLRESQAIPKGSVTSKRQGQACCLLEESIWMDDQLLWHT